MKQRWPRLTTVVVALFLAAGCSSGSGSGSTGGGGTLRIGISDTIIESLNPFVGESSLSALAYRVVYPHLLQYDTHDQITTDFARSYKVSNGGRRWTFTTRSGGRWSDHHALTAADAAWTINTILHFQKGPAAQLSRYVAGIVTASAPSPTTLVVDLSAPTSTLPYDLANIPILPQHIWEKYASGSGAQLTTYPNSNPVGAGPFLVSNFSRNQSAIFKRNSSYYGQQPSIAAFGFQFFGNNDAMVSALRNNQIDVALDLPATTVATLKSDKSLRVTATPNFDTVLLGINSNPQKPTNRELLNPTVRQAIALAMNYQGLVKTVTLGYGGVTPSIIPPTSTFSDRSLPVPTYDPAKANQLLDGLGFHRGPGGVRVVPATTGQYAQPAHPMRYQLLFGNTTTGAPLDANLVVGYLKAVGIEAAPIESDPNAYTAAITAAHYTKFDLSLDDYGPDFDPTNQLALPTCGQLGAENETGYCSKQYDNLFVRQAHELGATRQQTINQMQAIVARDKMLIPLFTSPNIVVERQSVHGFPTTPLSVINYESSDWLNTVTVG